MSEPVTLPDEVGRNVIGYVLEFYKRLSDTENTLKGDFKVRTFGHFDAFNFKKIQYIDEFGKLGSSEVTAHSEVQTLNLYKNIGDKHNKDIFTENQDMPVIMVSIINSYDKNVSIENLRESIEKSIKELNGATIGFDIFNVLSIEDCVVVFRSTSIADIFDVIDGVRKDLKSKDSENKTINFYSIAGVDAKAVATVIAKKDTSKWHWDSAREQQKNLYVSLRIHVYPYANFSDIVTNLKKYGLEDALEIQSISKQPFETLGKYDLQIIGKLKDTRVLMELFDNPLSLYADAGGSHKSDKRIISSNTNFLRPFELEIKEKEEPFKHPDRTGDNWERLIRDISGTPLVKLASVRLAERTHQLYHFVFSYKYSTEAVELVEKFFSFAKEYIAASLGKDDGSIEDLLKEITWLNLFIDNRFSYNFRDFECPQKDTRFVHSSGKMLMCYTRFIEKLLEGLGQNTPVFVIADSNRKMESENIKDKNELPRFYCFRMPGGNVFEVGYTLALLAHECGHKIEISEELKILRANVISRYLILEYEKLNPKDRDNIVPSIMERTTNPKLKITPEEVMYEIEKSIGSAGMLDKIKETKIKDVQKLLEEIEQIDFGKENEGIEFLDKNIRINGRGEALINQLNGLLVLMEPSVDEVCADIYMVEVMLLDINEYFEIVLKNLEVEEHDENTDVWLTFKVRVSAIVMYFLWKKSPEIFVYSNTNYKKACELYEPVKSECIKIKQFMLNKHYGNKKTRKFIESLLDFTEPGISFSHFDMVYFMFIIGVLYFGRAVKGKTDIDFCKGTGTDFKGKKTDMRKVFQLFLCPKEKSGREERLTAFQGFLDLIKK
ncbi:hypothetical protein FACS1894188_09060 [Clostridia bacterium]|nr:hypothetical protein FACS1894188_09060 [Clostridia bacterium]